MMSRRRRKDGLGLAKPPIHLREPLEEAGHRTRADSDMGANLHIPLSPFARYDADTLPGRRPQKIVRQAHKTADVSR